MSYSVLLTISAKKCLLSIVTTLLLWEVEQEWDYKSQQKFFFRINVYQINAFLWERLNKRYLNNTYDLCSLQHKNNPVVQCLDHHLPLHIHWLWCLQSCFSHVFTSLFWLLLVLHIFSLLHKNVIPEALPPPLTGSALASVKSLLKPAGIGSIGHGGSF